jgi:hypothetical protein
VTTIAVQFVFSYKSPETYADDKSDLMYAIGDALGTRRISATELERGTGSSRMRVEYRVCPAVEDYARRYPSALAERIVSELRDTPARLRVRGLKIEVKKW